MHDGGVRMTDLTIKVLQQIRDEITLTRTELSSRIDQTNSRIDETNSRIDETNSRLGGTNSRLESLERRHTGSEVRLATELTAVVGAIGELKEIIVADRNLRGAIRDHENRIQALEKNKPG